MTQQDNPNADPCFMPMLDGSGYYAGRNRPDPRIARPLPLNGEVFLLRRMFDRVLFRRTQQHTDEGWTYFLPEPLEENTDPDGTTDWQLAQDPDRDTSLAAITPEAFRAALEARSYGRCVAFHVPDAQQADVLLFFFPDGNGFFQEWGDKVPFSWFESAQNFKSASDILDKPVKQLHDLCNRVFCEQVWPVMQDPYLRADEDIDSEGEPTEFICGSEAELRRVTRWICYTETGFFDDPDREPVMYQAKTPEDEGGLYEYWDDENTSERLKTLCALAFEYNAFTGFGYEYNDQNGHRRSGYDERPALIEVEFDPPSAHDRIEAFLDLSEWLEGKVTAKEKAVLLGTTTGASIPT